MKKLEIIDLHVEVDGKEILKGVTITFHPNRIHAILGPNGSGKSTLAHAIIGHPKYKITQGKIILDSKDITTEKPHLRAQAGLFLSFQYPQEIPGISLANFLRTAVNNRGKKYSVLEFHKIIKEKMALLKIDPSFLQRSLNEGFSGGEKKRMEILQLMLLQPHYALLDETDSGLDVDAIKIVAAGVKKVMKEQRTSIIIITHHQRFIEYLPPQEVSIMHQGKIIIEGDHALAKKIEQGGFEKIIEHAQQRKSH